MGDDEAPSSFSDIVVDLSKLRDYCLNPAHPRGRHKARVFRTRLGVTQADAAWLQQLLIASTKQRLKNLKESGSDHFGRRYVIDLEARVGDRSASV